MKPVSGFVKGVCLEPVEAAVLLIRNLASAAKPDGFGGIYLLAIQFKRGMERTRNIF